MSPGGSAGGTGGSQQLANLIVQFSLQGQQQLQQALSQVQQQTGQVFAAINQLGTQLQAQMSSVRQQTAQTAGAVGQLAQATARAAADMKAGIERIVTAIGQFHFDWLNKVGDANKKTDEATKKAKELGGAFEHVGQTVNVALGAAIAPITNFVRQGLGLGVMGQMLQFRMERLALAITGLFRPEITAVTSAIERLTGWISNLSDRQRESVAHWIQGAAAALGMALVFPKIVTGIQAVIGVARGLQAAISGALSATGIGAFLPALGLVVEGLTALLVGTKTGRYALGQMWEAAKSLGRALGDLADALHLHDFFGQMADDVAVCVMGFADLARAIADATREMTAMMNSDVGQFMRGLAGAIVPGVGSLAAILRGHGYRPPEPRPKNRHTENFRAHGFESLEHVYERIAAASVGVKGPAEQQVDLLTQIHQTSVSILNWLGQQRPATVGSGG